MADEDRDPKGDSVRSVPLPGEDGDEVIAQQNMSPEVAAGGGYWPSPTAPPAGPSPGTVDDGAEAARRRAEEPFRQPPAGSSSQPDQQQDATTAGDRGPARSAYTEPGDEADQRTPMLKDVLDADPVTGGSRSVAPGAGPQREATDPS